MNDDAMIVHPDDIPEFRNMAAASEGARVALIEKPILCGICGKGGGTLVKRFMLEGYEHMACPKLLNGILPSRAQRRAKRRNP